MQPYGHLALASNHLKFMEKRMTPELQAKVYQKRGGEGGEGGGGGEEELYKSR